MGGRAGDSAGYGHVTTVRAPTIGGRLPCLGHLYIESTEEVLTIQLISLTAWPEERRPSARCARARCRRCASRSQGVEKKSTLGHPTTAASAERS